MPEFDDRDAFDQRFPNVRCRVLQGGKQVHFIAFRKDRQEAIDYAAEWIKHLLEQRTAFSVDYFGDYTIAVERLD